VVGKKVNTGGLQIMVEGDLAMQRPFVVMEANPKRFPRANDVGARKLSSFLLSREIQELLPQYKG
jgi:tungstate transport system substrate-binding protein